MADRDDSEEPRYDLGQYASALPPGSSRGPPPRQGQDEAFDDHVLQTYGVLEGNERYEMRRAAWATWRTEAPTTVSGNSGRQDEEDDELQRAIAASLETAQDAGAGSSTHTRNQDEADDEDDELQRAIAASKDEERAAKRRRIEGTPEEERAAVEAALAASLQDAPDDADLPTAGEPSTSQLGRHDSDEFYQRKNREYQEQRAVERERQRLERQQRGGSGSGSRPASPVVSQSESTASAQPGSSGLGRPPASTSKTTVPPAGATADPTSRSSSGSGLSVDRAQLEQERLARQKAREAGFSSAPDAAPAPAEAVNSSSTPITENRRSTLPHIPRPRIASAKSTDPPSILSIHPLQSARFPADHGGEYYPDGELRSMGLTIGDPTSEPTFAPEQVIGTQSQISLLIISSYVIDDEWLSTIIPSADKCPQIIIRPHPKDQPTWNGKVQAQPGGGVFCYPKMMGEWGSAHMKFLWIKYKTGRLRVVISTANIVPYDWDWIENDFLPARTPAPLQRGRLSHDLPLQFRFLLIHLKVHKALRYLVDSHANGPQINFSPDDSFAVLDSYDWSRSRVKLIMSIPGTLNGWREMDGFGMGKLGSVVREEGWKPKAGEKAVVEYQYGFDWFETFYQICAGKSPQEIALRPKAKDWAPMKVMYPSLGTVERSHLGRDGGGTMFVGKAWTAPSKHLFHDAKSKRGGILMHSKMLVTLFEPQERTLGFQPVASSSTSPSTTPNKGKRKAEEMEGEQEDGGVGGWVYVGSHNFSSAAWGTMNLKKTPPTLTVRNYELGIIFPLPRKNARQVADRVVPYKRPIKQYAADDIPWDQNLHGVDIPEQ